MIDLNSYMAVVVGPSRPNDLPLFSSETISKVSNARQQAQKTGRAELMLFKRKGFRFECVHREDRLMNPNQVSSFDENWLAEAMRGIPNRQECLVIWLPGGEVMLLRDLMA